VERPQDWLWRLRLAPAWRSEVAPPDEWRGYGVLMAAWSGPAL